MATLAGTVQYRCGTVQSRYCVQYRTVLWGTAGYCGYCRESRVLPQYRGTVAGTVGYYGTAGYCDSTAVL